MRIVNTLLVTGLVIFLAIQFFRPAKNLSGSRTGDITSAYPVTAGVKSILVKACNDCHSNHTRYPWYAEVQPVAWWLDDHVTNGRRRLDFDEFTSYRIARQYKKMEECINEVKDGGMPLPSYTWIHKDAVLTDSEKTEFIDWCNAVRAGIKMKYPADSLHITKR